MARGLRGTEEPKPAAPPTAFVCETRGEEVRKIHDEEEGVSLLLSQLVFCVTDRLDVCHKVVISLFIKCFS